ncbi:MAG TPA: hypothetical protein VGO93_10370 [Candidatus Xenobia bacterium]|jgi:hypothetical protein
MLTTPGQSPPRVRLHWHDAAWVIIASSLAALWIVLLTSPAWR